MLRKNCKFGVNKKPWAEKGAYDHWTDKSFLAEMHKGTAEYESGKAKLYTLMN